MNRSEEEVLQDELSKYSKLDSLATTEGGKQLVDQYIKDIVALIEKFTQEDTMVSFQLADYVRFTAKLKEKLNVVSVLNGAKEGKKRALERLEKYLRGDRD